MVIINTGLTETISEEEFTPNFQGAPPNAHNPAQLVPPRAGIAAISMTLLGLLGMVISPLTLETDDFGAGLYLFSASLASFTFASQLLGVAQSSESLLHLVWVIPGIVSKPILQHPIIHSFISQRGFSKK